MFKRLSLLTLFVTSVICSFASRTSVYLSRCPNDDATIGNKPQRTSGQPLCIWQEQNCIYVPQGNNIHCVLLNTDGVVHECIAPASGVVVFPTELQGQYKLLIQMDGVSYIGEICL